MQWYRIKKICPKDGLYKPVHRSIQNRQCQIVNIPVGERGLLRVDVGDKLIGPHRIVISKVIDVSKPDGDKRIIIVTENTVYYLEKYPNKIPDKREYISGKCS